MGEGTRAKVLYREKSMAHWRHERSVCVTGTTLERTRSDHAGWRFGSYPKSKGEPLKDFK